MLLGSSRKIEVWARAEPTDLRKGYNGLFGLVKQQLKRDPMQGALFLFVNRRRTSCKVLFWDGTGLCIFQKRLEKGRFACLWGRSDDDAIRLTTSELQLFIEGSELVGRRRLSPDAYVPIALADEARV